MLSSSGAGPRQEVDAGSVMTVSLRLATESDADSVAALLTEVGYPTNAGEAWRRLAGVRRDPAARVLVAVGEPGIMGFLSALLVPYFPDGSTICRITSIVVAKAHRRHGVGATLLQGVTEFAKQRRCSGVEITTAERRAEAQHFYERFMNAANKERLRVLILSSTRRRHKRPFPLKDENNNG